MSDRDGGQVETILEVGAEGGSITLEGHRPGDGEWRFRVRTNESALLDLLGEEDHDAVAAPTQASWASWSEAMRKLNTYPWPRLYPLTIHPEFADRILAAVSEYAAGDASAIERWRRLAGRRGARSESH